MMATKHEITRDDIMPIERYAAERKERRRKLIDLKRSRRLEVGPVCTFHFENYETMWNQMHEMLFIEKGGEAQIPDELTAYNPLVPNGRELVATVMFEIDDPVRRHAFLAKLGGVEETAFLEIEGETIVGRPEKDVDRTSAAGKASSVQFIHFDLNDTQAARFKAPGSRIVLGFTHPSYSHMTALSEDNRAALAEDLD
jgi:hypothetical protein